MGRVNVTLKEGVYNTSKNESHLIVDLTTELDKNNVKARKNLTHPVQAREELKHSAPYRLV